MPANKYPEFKTRCRIIIASDAECDPDFVFGSLGNVICICEVDFGAKIDIDVTSIRQHPDTRVSASHCAIGKIHYSDGTEGYLIYMKSSLTADAETAVLAYKTSHPDFPHETTADQFFSDDQFESYRMLGLHSVENALADRSEQGLGTMAERIMSSADRRAPARPASG